ncbi:MAG: NRDE family protein [Ferruginibacter sp.]
MCTVTFIPVKDRIYITSNRDEKFIRKQAIPPELYFVNGNRIIYPRDADAGGTWIAMNENGCAAVLLNGAFQKHTSMAPYRKSRGIIFLEIINAIMPVRYFTHMALSGIEPFTMIIFDNCLYECRWTGSTKHCRQLKKYRPYIWSSSTLYDEKVVKKREQWFAAFLNKNPLPAQDDIFAFHKFTGDGDTQNDLNMNRNGLLSTVSVTGIAMEFLRCNMRYLDLKDRSIHNKEMKLVSSIRETADIF